MIPKAVEDLNAGLVVLGTSGRTGLSAVFLGNTAENIIDKINCDVLALKPSGYISLSTLTASSHKTLKNSGVSPLFFASHKRQQSFSLESDGNIRIIPLPKV
ncbi:universal stress protein E [Vibrio ishigakensis]|uniref:Universal stress protein E n=1 Tax=Vibrio ishigakensis TaxID=1481914 RepID=A0A0B8QMI5_9VIBR|nr:universal stress protein E [Vibrio ishigakensis]